MLDELVKVFLAFLIIMDPFVSALYLIEISRGSSREEKRNMVNLATLIAGITLVLFLFGGPVTLALLGVTITSFKIAGGLILLIISIHFILGASTGQQDLPPRG